MTTAPDLARHLSQMLRADRGRLLAALIGDLRSFDLAEDCLSDAVESALIHWARSGLPDRPFAWLLRVARRKAIDRLRRSRRWADREADLTVLTAAESAEPEDSMSEIPDDRLRLIFTCCHPALDAKSQVALTLRTLCGLTTPEIARAFLDTEPTMGQRLSRAKAKIAAAGIPYAVPGPDQWDARLGSVLRVIYLVFNEGYAATAGDDLIRAALCDEAIHLARILLHLRPAEPEALGLLSLMLSTHARAAARLGPDGAMIGLADQDRTRWNAGMVADSISLLDRAVALNRPGPFQIQAAIGALIARAPSHARTDWSQIADLYDALYAHEPTDVVRLNRAVARAEAGDLAAALHETEALAQTLARYQPFHAARAELLSRAGQGPAARAAYAQAMLLSGTEAERAFLARRRDEA
jgi:RNA polymerase sigma-70 factor (ECF subfamily)